MMTFPPARIFRPSARLSHAAAGYKRYGLVLAASLIVSGQVFGEGKEGQPKPVETKERLRDKGEAARLEVWESLSDEQREKLRQALRDVWTDPAVIAAREEVKQAGDAYQAAIKAAVSRADPSVAEVMSKIQRSNSGVAHEHIWGRAPVAMGQGGKGLTPTAHPPGFAEKGGSVSRRGFDDQIKPPGFFDGMPPEVRVKFRAAEESAMASEAVKAARAELDRIRGEDELLRRKRLEAHRKLRKVTLDEIVRIDPSLAEVRKALAGEDRREGARPEGPGHEEGRAGKPAGPAAPRDPKPE